MAKVVHRQGDVSYDTLLRRLQQEERREHERRRQIDIEQRASLAVLHVEWGSRDPGYNPDRPQPEVLTKLRRPRTRPTSSPAAFTGQSLPPLDVCGTGAKTSGGERVRYDELRRPKLAVRPKTAFTGAARFLTQVPPTTLERASKSQQLVKSLTQLDPEDAVPSPNMRWCKYRFAPGWTENQLKQPSYTQEQQFHLKLIRLDKHSLLFEAIQGASAITSEWDAWMQEVKYKASRSLRDAAAVTIQKVVRGRQGRAKVLMRCMALLVLQCTFRMWLAQRELARRKTTRRRWLRYSAAAVEIQAAGRGLRHRWHLHNILVVHRQAMRRLTGVVLLQRVGRGSVARERSYISIVRETAACCIQRSTRCHLARIKRRCLLSQRLLRNEAGLRYKLFLSDLRRLEVVERKAMVEVMLASRERVEEIWQELTRTVLLLQALKEAKSVFYNDVKQRVVEREKLMCHEASERCHIRLQAWRSDTELYEAMLAVRWASRILPPEEERIRIVADFRRAEDLERAAISAKEALDLAGISDLAPPPPKHLPVEAKAESPPPSPRAEGDAAIASALHTHPAARPLATLADTHHHAVEEATRMECEAHKVLSREEAAADIQRVFRGHMGRRAHRREWVERAGRLFQLTCAATTIQKMVRGHLARRWVSSNRVELERRCEAALYARRSAVQHRAARVVQLWVRRCWRRSPPPWLLRYKVKLQRVERQQIVWDEILGRNTVLEEWLLWVDKTVRPFSRGIRPQPAEENQAEGASEDQPSPSQPPPSALEEWCLFLLGCVLPDGTAAAAERLLMREVCERNSITRAEKQARSDVTYRFSVSVLEM